MARVAYLNKADLPEADHDVLARSINLFRVLAYSPDAARAVREMGSFIKEKSKIDRRIREMAIIQVALAADADYVYSHHVKIGLDGGVSPEDVKAIREETAGRATNLDGLTRAALLAAREMTHDAKVSDVTYAALAKHWAPALMVEFLLIIAFYNCTTRFMSSVKIDVEDEYAPYLAKFPMKA